MKRLALLFLAALTLSFAPAIPWIPFYGGKVYGVLRHPGQADHWRIVYDPGRTIMVDTTLGGGGTFAPDITVYNGLRQVVGSFTGQPGDVAGGVLMLPGGTVTNVLDVRIGANGGVLPAGYRVWKQ